MSMASIARRVAAVAVAVAFAAPAGAQTPGTVPPSYVSKPQVARPDYAPDVPQGLKVFYRKFGKVTLSVDAGGKVFGGYTVSAKKPSKTAKVAKAYLTATAFNGAAIPNGAVKIDGESVSWKISQSNDATFAAGFFTSVLGDVTDIVKDKLDAAAPGDINFNVTESVNEIDGTTLLVVFKTPDDKRSKTVALLFGGLKTTGDVFSITTDDAINPQGKNALANMGLGISYSFQTGGIQQYSIIDVNGQRMTTAAGGEDDGESANGGLITAGGIGDTTTNPSNPTGFPINQRSDDERYSLLPFMKKGDKQITIKTLNPSNDDNIFLAYFELSAEGEVDKDTDGDGLLDVWEKDGLDFDADGTIDVKLPGANPEKKDLYIAYAWMDKSPTEANTHQPTAAQLDAVAEAFARAPVDNPDGSKGITVHYKNLGKVPHDPDLNPVWTQFDAIMNPLVSEAERVVYHRMLNAHSYSGGTSSGISRGIPASDFIESLGAFPSNPGTFQERAGTIMHELGHNLGLMHGGVDHVNYKPNHLSVMSYLNQFPWLLKNKKPYLDYERFALKKREENKLDERKGIRSKTGDITHYGARWVYNGTIYERKTNSNKDVDWNRNGTIQSLSPTDINGDGVKGPLRASYVEWDNLVFDGGSIGATGAASEKASTLVAPSDLREFDLDDYKRLEKRRVVED